MRRQHVLNSGGRLYRRVAVALTVVAVLNPGLADHVEAGAPPTVRYVHPTNSIGGGSCASPDANGVQAAIDASVPGDTVIVCAGVHTITTTLTIDKSLILEGEDPAMSILDGGGTTRILRIPKRSDSASVAVTIDNLTFRRGYAGGNTAGGAIAVDMNNTVVVDHSTFYANSATEHGGAIDVRWDTSDGSGCCDPRLGSLQVQNSTFVGNTGVDGGAINFVNAVASTTPNLIVNSTFVGNTASRNGGAINVSFASATVSSSTFVDNSGSAGASALYGSVTLDSSVIARSDNSASAMCDVSSVSSSIATSTCGAATISTFANLQLGQLGFWGGPTQTVPVGTSSTAIDAVASGCRSDDQRGTARVSTCTAGAFEYVTDPAGITPLTQTITTGPGAVMTPSSTFTETNFDGAVTYSLSTALPGITPLPSGLTIDSTTGVLSGTPSAALATTKFLVTATSATKTASAIIQLTIAKANQTITVTTNAPASARLDDTFDVAATSSAGLPVTIGTSGGCTGGGTDTATITITSAVTSCVIAYTQAGNSAVEPAPRVTETVLAADAPPIPFGEPLTWPAGIDFQYASANSVSCAAAGSCTAVGAFASTGYNSGFIARSTSGVWGDIEPFAMPASFGSGSVGLMQVSCTNPNSCVVIGNFYEDNGVNRLFWKASTGGVWSEVEEIVIPATVNSSPLTYPFLYRLSCGAVGDCVATGDVSTTSVSRPFAMYLSGGNWTFEPLGWDILDSLGNPSSYLPSLSCGAMGECVAVGTVYGSGGTEIPALLVRSGGSWAPVILTLPSTPGVTLVGMQLNSVSCVGGACTAVGSVLDENFNRWPVHVSSSAGVWSAPQVVDLPTDPFGSVVFSNLQAVSCASAGNCSALGSFSSAGSPPRLFTVTSTGGNWEIAQPLPLDGFNEAFIFESFISCGAPGSCLVAGSVIQFNPFSFGGVTASSSEGVWDAAKTIPFRDGVLSPSSPWIFPRAVSCTATRSCAVVGSFQGSDDRSAPFTQTWGDTGTPPSSSLLFNGSATGSVVSVADAPALQLTDAFSIEADVIWDGTNGYHGIVSKPRFDDENDSGTGATLALNDGKPGLAIITTTGQERYLELADALPVGEWHTIKGDYDGNTLRLFVDGTLVDFIEYEATAAADGGATPLLIGREFVFNFAGRAFHGAIDNVKIATGASLASLQTVLDMPFDEGSGTTTADRSTNTFVGTLSPENTPQWMPVTQTITVTASAPATKRNGGTFDVSATASSGLAVAITTSGSCSGSGTSSATITMNADTGTCVVAYDQPGNWAYGAATQITESVTASPAQTTQSITVTTAAPGSKVYGGTFSVAATASSGLDVAITTTGGCTGTGTNTATITMTSGTTTCTVAYNQSGDADYFAADEVLETTTATKATPTCSITGYTVAYDGTQHTATGSCTGIDGELTGLDLTGTAHTNAGTYTADPWTFTDTTGNYSNDSGTVDNTISKASQSITVTTAAPGSKVYGGTFSVAATSSSGLSVAITTTGGCTGSGTNSATITMTSGTTACTVAYNQTGNINYNTAPEITDTTNPSKASQSITVTTSAPGTKVYGGTFSVAATASSGLDVAITTTGGCTGSGTNSATITMTSGTTTCTVAYNQTGNTNYNTAPEKIDTTTATKIVTSVLYTGGQIVTAPTALKVSAQTTGDPSCAAVSYALERNPVTQASVSYPLTVVSGSVATTGWMEGVYQITTSYGGGTNCNLATDQATLTVAGSGTAATGGGFYTLSGAGRVNVGFTVRAVPKTTPTQYRGEIVIINNGKWRLKGTVSSYVKTSTTGAIGGTGSLFWWDSSLNGGLGGWVLAATNVSYTASMTATTKTAPGSIGLKITYTPTSPQPSSLPNSTPQNLKGGKITLN